MDPDVTRPSDPPAEADQGSGGGDGLTLGLAATIAIGVLGAVAMVAAVLPGILILVPVGVGIVALLGLQLLVYRLFGLRIRGREEPPRRGPGPTPTS